MKRILFSTGLLALLASAAHALPPAVFTPGQIAVIQFGDGGTNRCLPLGAVTSITNYSASDIFGSRQNPIFIDQFDPNGVNQTNPSVQIAVPTNGYGALMVNGNAGTEGNMTLSDDRSVLTFAGYAGDILSITTGGQTAPSNLSYERGVATVDAFGNYTTVYRGNQWYGTATGKTNPRGVATDGAGHFWGCGNGYGSLYYDAASGSDPVQFQNIALTSCSKVINHVLYNTVKGSESVNLYPAGIYTCVDFYGNPVNLPTAASYLHLFLQAQAPYTNCIGFDLNPDGTVAYVADVGVVSKAGAILVSGGIQKYIKTGLNWKLAYNLAIPGYTNLTSGILADPARTNVLMGCFSVAVDWTGTNPVVYATTADCGQGAASPYYGNRVIRINDTNTTTSGANIILTTNMNILTTVARPGLDAAGLGITNIVYKSVTLTPDLRPLITSSPASWAATVGDNVSFNVTASANYDLSYQWLQNGTNLAGANAATLNLNAVTLDYDNYTYQCVVADFYGSVTSAVANLTATATAVPPSITSVTSLTNYYGNNQNLTAKVAGTDPKGGYQWYFNGQALTDGPTGNGSTLSGTTSPTLSLVQAAVGDAGNYSLSLTNIAGATSNLAVNLTLTYSPPVLVQPPVSITTFVGRNAANPTSAYGQLLAYQWYKSKANGTSLVPLSDTGEYSGTATPTLAINPVSVADATNYVLIISNPGGSITSSPAPLTVTVAPPHTFVAYTNQTYTQNFDSLPIPGGSSAEGGNPLTISFAVIDLAAITANPASPLTGAAIGTLTYSMDNPLDFGYPVFTTGHIGGYGLSNSMAGWYGWGQNALIISATRGDQSQGAIVDNGGNYLADGTSLAGVTNRALGLVATTKTGVDTFAVAFFNRSTNTLNTINLSYLGEIWRNNPNQQVLQFGYALDPAGTNSVFLPAVTDGSIASINGNALTSVASLNVAFPVTAGTTINDGTQATNQLSFGVTNLTIADWAPGTTLWLVWQADTLGTAQDVAIDNLSFRASNGAIGIVITPFTITPDSVMIAGTGAAAAAHFSFTNAPGLSFSVLGTNNLTAPPATWPLVGTTVENPAGSGHYQFTDLSPATNTARFYLLRQP